MIEHKLDIPQLGWDKVIDIGSRREVFWDCYLVDSDKTTAKLTINRPTKLEPAFELDAPWEGNSVSYPEIVRVDDIYRMYYLTGNHKPDSPTGATCMCLCMMESTDGINWTRPNLGICEWDGTRDNNIIMMESEENFLDNFFVFYDENPDCLPEERFKATSQYDNHNKPFPGTRELWCYTSPDGINFKRGWKMTDGTVPNGGIFDSMNVAYWDKCKNKYVSYVRGLHDGPGRGTANGLRDIRYMESDDFKIWSDPVILDYGDADDYELYTNNVSRYMRAPHIMTGFPTRYTERHWLTRNFDFLGGSKNLEMRKKASEKVERLGFVITDGLFMSSRDGLSWHRFDEAMFVPDAENDYNWVYGDCYPAYGMIETPRPYPHKTNEISMYLVEGHQRIKPNRMYRYVVRLDGFASYHADYKESRVVTKPIFFDGESLELNFKTSGRGYIYVRILDYYGKPIEGYQSYEIFGDAYDRLVTFDNGAELSRLKGKPIRLEFVMSDADIYSIKFNKEEEK